ncbi:preprotein translocase subunit YajC [Kiloniella sp. EL199]|uniref:preprotein translocase subunit YajC n=1 Tax=Kiloniella sp. EL199 TaxID=2107581 RepID=UPI000EA15C36|nr:preprotein translocase subunit YajC [Kiloniella sp. EL199]
MLISTAYAQAAGGAGSPNELFATLFPLVLIFAVFYFLIIRPQSKKMKQQKAMIDAIRRGDKVVTAGGIVGTVAKVKDGGEVQVDIAENVRITVIQSTIASVVSKTEPADKSANDDKDKKDKKSKD